MQAAPVFDKSTGQESDTRTIPPVTPLDTPVNCDRIKYTNHLGEIGGAFMVQYIIGDIFESPAQTIVNTVNTVGVMGKGLALQFKQRYPEMFTAYRDICEQHRLMTGTLMLYSAPDHIILLFPTKENWRNPSRLDYIERGLQKFVSKYSDYGITSIAFPRLGCGNGELNWEEVQPVMEHYLNDLPIEVYIYLGNYDDPEPEHRNPKMTMSWLKENAKDLSFDALCDDITINSTLFPFDFYKDGDVYSAYMQEDLHIDNKSGSKFIINRDDFYSMWDQIRADAVFADATDREHRLVYALLYSLGYLDTICLINDKGEKESGYQLRAGIGRIYAIDGIKK